MWVSEQPWCNGKVALTVSQGRIEALLSYLDQLPSAKEYYWEDKWTHPERIDVPTYVVASWTNPVHTPGTFKAWSCLPDDIPKWLRVHNRQEWSDYYSSPSREDLRRSSLIFISMARRTTGGSKPPNSPLRNDGL